MTVQLSSYGIGALVGWNYEQVATPSNSVNADSFRYSPTAFATGTGEGQVDRLFVASTTLAAGAQVNYSLTNFVDYFGNTVSMARFKLLWFSLPAVGAADGPASGGVQSTNFAVGAAASPLKNFTTARDVRNGGITWDCAPVDATGWTIAAGSTDTLKLINSDSTNNGTYTLCIMGCSA